MSDTPGVAAEFVDGPWVEDHEKRVRVDEHGYAPFYLHVPGGGVYRRIMQDDTGAVYQYEPRGQR